MTEHKHVNPWLIAVSVMFATFMEVLDTTVVNVSLPHIAGSLSASIDEATWALTSYLVANAIILPMTGWLASMFGRKRLLMMAVVGFTSASFLCGVAPDLRSLIIFRIIQGACGGALQPISQAVLLEAFPPQDRGKAMAFWGLGIVVAPMLGPVLGERSVLLLDGSEHMRHRRLMLPAFHGQRMKAYDSIMRDAADREIDSWPVGEPFELLPAMQALTLDVIMRAVFGVSEGQR